MFKLSCYCFKSYCYVFQLPGRMLFRAEIAATLLYADINESRAKVLDMVEYFHPNKDQLMKELLEKEAEEEQGKLAKLAEQKTDRQETKAETKARLLQERRAKAAEDKRLKELERQKKKQEREMEKRKKEQAKQEKDKAKKAKKTNDESPKESDDMDDMDKQSTIDKKLDLLKVKLKK